MRRLLLLLTVFIAFGLSAQTDKKINKAIKTFEKDYTKGIKKMRKLMGKESSPRLRAWEVLVDMEYFDYLKYDEIYRGMTITTFKEGEEVAEEDDTTDEKGLSFADLMVDYNKNSFKNLCREATLVASSTLGDDYLRKIMLELDPDTLVSEKGKLYFDEAEEFFEKDDYELAILNYKKAIGEDSTYYFAHINLGISFWRNEKQADSALFYISKARDLQPTFLSPIKFMVEILVKEGLYFRAKKECLEGLCTYPGLDMKRYYQEVLYVENKQMYEHRLTRSFYPNDITNDDQEVFTGPFKSYREAKDKISKFTDDNGIIEANGQTDDIYLEVYSWHQLLDDLKDDLPAPLEFAKEMDDEGYLDCYVLVSLFHYDLYPQFKHFMSVEGNKARVKEYVTKYLVIGIEDY